MAKASSVVLTCVLFTISGLTQVNASAVHAAFGQPTTETFNVAPDILLTAMYDADDNACSLVFERTVSTSYVERDATTGELYTLLDKVVPAHIRGEKLQEGISIDGCAGSKQTSYENLVITETVFANVNPSCETLMRLEVGFKRKACALDKVPTPSVGVRSPYH